MSKSSNPDKKSGFGDPLKYEHKNPIVAWFKNYWYYYKSVVLVVGLIAVVAIWVIVDIVTAVEDDLRFYTITESEISYEAIAPLEQTLTPYITDTNGDEKISLGNSCMRLAANPADEEEAAAYQKIMAILMDETVTVLLVDEFVFNFLLESDALETLENLGLEGVDEYRILANDSTLLETSDINDVGPMYLVFRVRQENKLDDEEVNARYDIAVSIAADVASQVEQVLEGTD